MIDATGNVALLTANSYSPLRAVPPPEYNLVTTSIYEAADRFIAGLQQATMPYARITGFTNVVTQSAADGIGLNWLTDAIAAGRNNCNKKILVSVISGLSELLSKKQFTTVDAIFRSLNPNSLSPEVLVAISRTSFAARHKLKTWAGMIKWIKDEFELRKLDSRGLMQGLG